MLGLITAILVSNISSKIYPVMFKDLNAVQWYNQSIQKQKDYVALVVCVRSARQCSYIVDECRGTIESTTSSGNMIL